METKKNLKLFLANLWVSFFNIRNAHWNIESLNFLELHKFFQELYGFVEDAADDIAERIRQLEDDAPASMTKYLSLATLKSSESLKTEKECISVILANFEALDIQLITIMSALDKRDEASRNLLAGQCQQFEKYIWFLKSFK